MPTLTLEPAVDADSGEESTTDQDTVLRTGTTLRLGKPGTEANHTAIRFPLSVTGELDGLSINSVQLKLRAAATDSGTYACTLYMQESATPATITAGAANQNISNAATRPRTTASVDVGSTNPDFSSWVSGEDYSITGDGSTDLKELLDEVIATAGAANIDAIMLLMIYSGTDVGERVFRSEGQTNPPQLIINYGTPAGTFEDTAKVTITDERRVVV